MLGKAPGNRAAIERRLSVTLTARYVVFESTKDPSGKKKENQLGVGVIR